MAYGVKRGVKAPGEWGMGDLAGLALSGAAGIVAALVTDFQSKGETSALFTLNRWVIQLGELLGFGAVPLWMVVVGVTMVGAGSIFYFQPITRQGAFAQGFGLLAVITTAVPADLVGGLQGINDTLQDGGLAPIEREAAFTGGAAVIPASYVSSPAPAQYQQVQQRAASRYDVKLTITFPNGIPGDVNSLIRRGELRGRLHNDDTGETFSIFRSSGAEIAKLNDNTLHIRAGVPARAAQARLLVRIECRNYAIEEQSAIATLNSPLNWNIDMRSSNMPLMLQRLQKSYAF